MENRQFWMDFHMVNHHFGWILQQENMSLSEHGVTTGKSQAVGSRGPSPASVKISQMCPLKFNSGWVKHYRMIIRITIFFWRANLTMVNFQKIWQFEYYERTIE